MYCLYLEQAGEGCDYTIGCGQKLEPLEADNFKDALIEACEHIQDYGYHSDHYGIAKAFIVKVEHNLMHEIDSFREREEEAKREEELSRKLAEFERLKKELGK